MSVHDSDLADIWIDENYDHEVLILLREKKICGPIASLLSVGSPALTIFGVMSIYLIRTAEVLATISGFPVIVRPLDEDPSPRFRSANQLETSLSLTQSADITNHGQILVGEIRKEMAPAVPATE